MSDINDEVRENGKNIAILETSYNHIADMLSDIKKEMANTRKDIHDFRNVAAHSKDVLQIQNDLVEVKKDIIDLKTEQANTRTRVGTLEESKKSLREITKMNLKDWITLVVLLLGGVWTLSHVWDDYQTHAMVRTEHEQAFSAHVGTDTDQD
jgi:predicted RNase H-like nuclease (RuvC/YqgF family)